VSGAGRDLTHVELHETLPEALAPPPKSASPQLARYVRTKVV